MSDKAKISLAIITKNEELVLERCIKSFEGAVDEVIVCDTGSTDKTIEIAKRCGAIVVYFPWNGSYADARQASFDACNGEWLIWADADDVLDEGMARRVQHVPKLGLADHYEFIWNVNGLSAFKTRMVRKDSGKWERWVHESYRPYEDKKTLKIKDISITHSPAPGKVRRSEEYISALKMNLKEAHVDLFHLAGEMHHKKEYGPMMRYASAALQLEPPPVERYELLFMMAIATQEPSLKEKLALQAYALMPYRREALVVLCQEALRAGKNKEALGYARSIIATPKPTEPIWTLLTDWYGWLAEDLYLTVLRRNGKQQEAAKREVEARKGFTPNFSLIHATRGRPKKMEEARELWYTRAKYPHMVEHIFCVDKDDKEAVKVATDYCYVITDPGGGCVAAWNAGAKLSYGQVLIQLSDDWIPPMHWDEILMQRIGPRVEEEAVVGVSDGIDRGGGKITDCMCLAILTRARYEAQGHMFHPDYKSVYSDNEFSDRAYQDGIVIEARDVLFEHTHPICGKAEMDETYKQQNAPERYKDGAAAYERRKNRRVNKKKLDRDYAAYILAAKDDFCLKEVSERLIEEGVKTLYYGIPQQYWNGTKNSKENVKEVLDIAARIKGSISMMLDVDLYRAEGRDILTTEAMVRNEMLQRMRSDGFDHVVVVDGDELWLPGTLRQIDDYVSDNSPSSLSMRMVPVAGLPGYPIEGAKDGAMVYLGPGCKFKYCRGSEGEQRMHSRRNIIHFTATRKTMAEIIQKHRESGHYTDPNYDFEGWIKKTLPNIKPGLKRAHMFVPWDTWPLVREFAQHEWAAIPESLKSYLGAPQ